MSDQSNETPNDEVPQPEVEKVVETTETHVEAPDPERHVEEHRADPEVVEETVTTTTTEPGNTPGEDSPEGE